MDWLREMRCGGAVATTFDFASKRNFYTTHLCGRGYQDRFEVLCGSCRSACWQIVAMELVKAMILRQGGDLGWFYG